VHPPPFTAEAAAAIECDLRAAGFAVISTDPQVAGGPAAVARSLAGIARAAINSAGRLIVFGGDTARAILHELNVTSVTPIGEILAGVPVSVFEFEGRAIGLITKAGGFGDPDTLAAIRRAI
jgi:4-hydroxythreonine-4-phosphate dehydrogenase